MRLRTQLFLAGSLTLLLPIFAWQFVQQTESFLRLGESRAQVATASMLARQISETMLNCENASPPAFGDTPTQVCLDQIMPSSADENSIYQHLANFGAINLDGHVADWEPWLGHRQRFTNGDGGPPLDVLMLSDGSRLYIMFKVPGGQIDFSTPQAPKSGDLMTLYFGSARAMQSIELTWEGRGRHRRTSATGSPVDYAVEDLPGEEGGYALEVALPLPTKEQQFGFRLRDHNGDAVRVLSNLVGQSGVPTELGSNHDAGLLLARFAPEGSRLWVLNSKAWVVASAGGLADSDTAENSDPLDLKPWLRSMSYRLLIANGIGARIDREIRDSRLHGSEIAAASLGEDATRWQLHGDTYSILSSTAVPILDSAKRIRGTLVLEKASDSLLILANNTLFSLIGASVAVFVLATGLLLGFAALLSQRIRRLRDAVDRAMDKGGQIRADYKVSRSADELGDLSRSFGHMLDQLGQYTQYLKSLGSKLSHELKTPLAVMRSSLENLAQADGSEHDLFLQRATDGGDRLAALLRSLSEASRIEALTQNAEFELLDLDFFLSGYVAAFAAANDHIDLSYQSAVSNVELEFSSDLMAQLLDKLLDNALSYCPQDGQIVVRLESDERETVLTVENSGPLLPQEMQHKLFDSLVSVRPEKGSEVHLGLGLYVVKLIAQAHGATPVARNKSDAGGVEIRVVFPATARSA